MSKSRGLPSTQLADPFELSGVLNRVLEALRAMRARGAFTQSETTSAATREFIAMTDPIAAWLDKFTVVAPDSLVPGKTWALPTTPLQRPMGAQL